MSQEPPQERLDALSVHCRAGQWEDAETLATSLTMTFHLAVWRGRHWHSSPADKQIS